MNLQQLKAAGGFIDCHPVKTQIEWDSNTFDVYVKRLSFGDVERLLLSKENPSVAMISAAVLLGEEHDEMSRDDAASLNVALAAKLIEAVNRVNDPASAYEEANE